MQKKKGKKHMNIIEAIEAIGFPLIAIIVMAWYLNKVQAENRQDQKEYNEKIIAQMQDVMQTNRTLLDTNATLVKGVDIKLDKLLEREA